MSMPVARDETETGVLDREYELVKRRNRFCRWAGMDDEHRHALKTRSWLKT